MAAKSKKGEERRRERKAGEGGQRGGREMGGRKNFNTN
jgi:hypothetical protein